MKLWFSMLATVVVAGLVFAGCSPSGNTRTAERVLSQEEIDTAAAFYGGNVHFTATQVNQMHRPSAPEDTQQEPERKRIVFSEGKIREELLEEQGMGGYTTIVRPDRGVVYSIWPLGEGQKAIVVEERLPSPKDAEGSLERTELAKGSLRGHPCIKCKVITRQEGRTTEWTTWEAVDLNRFPP